MKTFDIIINPAGASGRTKREWETKIQPLFDKYNVHYTVYYSTLNYDVSDIVRDLTITDDTRNIVLIGGDGSMNLAVNGIQNFQNTRIGLIPSGSGNDFALGLGIKKDISSCVKRIIEGKVYRIVDVGEVVYYSRENILKDEVVSKDGFVHHRFNISAGIGFDAHICQQAQISKVKKVLNKVHLGKLVYIFTAMKIIASTKRVNTKITIDGKEMDGQQLLFSVGMNTPYEGGGFKFCPHARENDGLLDFCIGNQLSQFDFFRIFPYAYNGAHLKFHGVKEARGKVFDITCEKPMWVHTDGEVACMSKHIQISLCEEKLQMLN